MKEYKFYKSTTLKNIGLRGSSILTFDLANKNKENIMLATPIYSSKYKFPIELALNKYVNNQIVTPFGLGTYLNIDYQLQIIDEETLNLYHPNGQVEVFKYGKDEEISDTETHKYYYSSRTSQYIVSNIVDDVIEKYTLNTNSLKLEFAYSANNTFVTCDKIYVNGEEEKYISITYENGIIKKLTYENKLKEEINFMYENNFCTSITATIKDGEKEAKKIITLDLVYYLNELKNINTKLEECSEYQYKRTITYHPDKIRMVVKDNDSTTSSSIEFGGELGNQYVTQVTNNHVDTNITYNNDYKTTLIDENGYKEEYFFNENYDLSYVLINNEYVQAYKYETDNRYDLLSISTCLNALLEKNGDMIKEKKHDYLFTNEYIEDTTCPGGSSCFDIIFEDVNNNQGADIYFNQKGGKFDVLNLLMWCKVVDVYNENLSINVTLDFYKEGVSIYKTITQNIDISFKHGEWYFGIATSQVNSDYDEVKVTITPSSYSNDKIRFKLGLFNETFTSLYKYILKTGELSKALVGKHIRGAKYDKNNQMAINNYVTNSLYNLKILFSVNSKNIEQYNEYDENNNLSSILLLDEDRNYMIKEMVYNSNGTLKSATDYSNNWEEFEYDENNFNLNKHTINDLKKEYTYNTVDDIYYGRLKKAIVKGTSSDLNQEDYIYNDYEKIYTFKHTCGVSNSFDFDYNEDNQISDVYLNKGDTQLLIYTCQYDEQGLLTAMDYGDSTKVFEYTYDDTPYKNISKISYQGSEKYKFTYEGMELKSIIDIDNNQTSEYLYDNLGNIKEVDLKENEVLIKQDKLHKDFDGNFDIEQNIINNEGISNEYVFSNKFDKKSTTGLEYFFLAEEDEDLYFTMMNKRSYIELDKYNEYIEYDGSSSLRNYKGKTINSQNKYVFANINVPFDYVYSNEGLKFAHLDGDKEELLYRFNNDKVLGNSYSIFFGFIMDSSTPSITNSPFPLLTINSKDYKSMIIINNTDQALNLTINDSNSNTKIEKIFSVPYLFDELHFLTLNIVNIDIGENSYKYLLTIFLDGKVVGNYEFSLTNKMENISFLAYPEDSKFSDYKTTKKGKLTSIIIDRNKVLSSSKINEYINKLLDVYNNKNRIKDFNMSINNDLKYDYFPLNKSLTSINGIKPTIFRSNNSINTLYDNFIYDNVNSTEYGNFVYVMKNQLLEYNLTLGKSGTVGFRYKAMEGKSTRLLMLVMDNFFTTIFLNSDGNLDYGIKTTYKNISVTDKYEWNDVIITWTKAVSGTSIESMDYIFKTYLNGVLVDESEITFTKDVSQTQIILGNEENDDDIYAYIEKVIYTDIGDIDGELLHNALLKYSINVEEVDKFSRLSKKLIKTKEDVNIINEYEYKTDSEVNNARRTYPILNKESVKVNGNIKRTFYYIFDSYGRVTNIIDINNNVSSSHEYTYDEKGQIIKEVNGNNTYEYGYDGIGNIIKISKNNAISSITYDGMLLNYNYNNNSITKYEGLYPVRREDTSSNTLEEYTWEGNKLKEITKSNKKIKYKYNVNGLRTLKEKYEEDAIKEKTCYYYNTNNLLIGETRISYEEGIESNRTTILYLYNPRGEMYGFKYNGAVYYYLRDALSTIRSIYDEEGNVVAEYNYSAYGSHIVLDSSLNKNTSSSFIGNINSIRYKGYYYDDETQLYWVSSRYYSPELCRWISPDSIEYLDPQSINGLNLYCYCGNDPINKYDPSGHAFISVLVGLGIAALIGAGIGAASYTAGQLIDYAITGDFEWSWGGFIGSTVGGAIGGAITFATAGIGGAFATMAGAFLSGAAMTSSTMIGENIAGDANYSLGDILISSLISGGISMASVGIMSKIKIPSLNAGRGSMSAVSKQMYTKFQRQIIKRVSMRTFTKMLAVEAYNGAAGNIMEWAYGISGAKDYVLNFF